MAKFRFGVSEVDFLGHTITADGIRPPRERVAALLDFAKPTTIKRLRGFLGTVNFSRRFIKGVAQMLASLNEILQVSDVKSTHSVVWTRELEDAFAQSKQASPCRRHPAVTSQPRGRVMTPQSNGMVERIHRQLNAALRCQGGSWYDALPIVLLGLRSAWKENMLSMPAELTYGEPIRLPGEFLLPSDEQITAPQLVRNLREHFRSIAPVSDIRHGHSKTFIFKDLASCTHVLVRDDPVGMAYRPPYIGPLRVGSRHEKYFIVWFRGPVGYQADLDRPTEVSTKT